METKIELQFEDIKDKMSWPDVVRYYFPNVTKEEAVYILWEETCYPMDTDTTLKQLFEKYIEEKGLIEKICGQTE